MKLPRRSSVRVGFVAIHSAPFASAIRQTPRYQRVGGERRLGAKGDLACIRHALSATTYAGHLARMSLTDIFRNNVEDCTFLAERSEDDETKLTFKRMEAACVPWPTNRSGWTSKDGNQKRRPIEMAISAGNFLLDSLL